MRFIPYIIIGFLAWYLLLRPKMRPPQPPPAADAERPRSSAGEDMVRCARCGVHLPRSEGIMSRGKIFCSEQHRLEHHS